MQDNSIIYVLIIGAAIAISWAVSRLNRNILTKHSEALARINDLEEVLLDIRDGTKLFFREKRSCPRINEHIVAKLKSSSGEELLEVSNISCDGALLKVVPEFKKGDMLELEIFLPLYPQPIAVRTEVVNVIAIKAAAKDKPKFEVGVKFVEISAPNKERLLETINVISNRAV